MNHNLTRFSLSSGQFFHENRYKNLWWELNGVEIGFGDLRDSDIQNIQENLEADEEFVGWNEHHHSKFKQTDTPIIRITKDRVKHRHDILREEGR